MEVFFFLYLISKLLLWNTCREGLLLLAQVFGSSDGLCHCHEIKFPLGEGVRGLISVVPFCMNKKEPKKSPAVKASIPEAIACAKII